MEFQEWSFVFNDEDGLEPFGEVSELLVVKRPDESDLDESDAHLLERLVVNAQNLKSSEQTRIGRARGDNAKGGTRRFKGHLVQVIGLGIGNGLRQANFEEVLFSFNGSSTKQGRSEHLTACIRGFDVGGWVNEIHHGCGICKFSHHSNGGNRARCSRHRHTMQGVAHHFSNGRRIERRNEHGLTHLGTRRRQG